MRKLNQYHITYFIPSPTPKLKGITIKANSIIDAILKFNYDMDYKIKEESIKYIIKL
jgi:hypothetical protein